ELESFFLMGKERVEIKSREEKIVIKWKLNLFFSFHLSKACNCNQYYIFPVPAPLLILRRMVLNRHNSNRNRYDDDDERRRSNYPPHQPPSSYHGESGYGGHPPSHHHGSGYGVHPPSHQQGEYGAPPPSQLGGYGGHPPSHQHGEYGGYGGNNAPSHQYGGHPPSHQYGGYGGHPPSHQHGGYGDHPPSQFGGYGEHSPSQFGGYGGNQPSHQQGGGHHSGGGGYGLTRPSSHGRHDGSSSDDDDIKRKKPTFKVYCKKDPHYSLAVRHNTVVLVPADSSDHHQHWYKDEKYSAQKKDEEGYPCFALINKATKLALKHSKGGGEPVQLERYDPSVMDVSVLWTQSMDFGEGYRTLRMVNNIRLNVDAFQGDQRIEDGNKIVLWEWNQGANQLWKIVRTTDN
ncbi:Ricin B, lectin domain containing protein, partial [Melia azedarach]